MLSVSLLAQQRTVVGRRAYSGSVNPQTTTYQVLASDFNAPCGTIPVASGTFTITLVASVSQPPAGQCLDIINYGPGVLTVARSGQNINGGTASLSIIAGSATAPTGVHILSNGVDYIASGWGAPPANSILPPVAFASIPSALTAGRLQMFTDSPYFAYDTGSSWTYILNGSGQFNPFVLGNFTAVNLSTSTTTNIGGVINMQDSESNTQFHGYCIAAPATPYTIFVPITYTIQNASFPSLTLGFSDGTKFENIRVTNISGGIQVTGDTWSTSTTGEGNLGSFLPLIGGMVSGLSVTDNGTNKIFKWYTDPHLSSPTTYLTETRTTFLTATQWCIGITSNGNGASLVNATFLGYQQQ